ncbi:MAG: hypothetical protein REI12_10395 [Pedobacter sp.]|nr:hypothetical protein [Pedobacter sp.]
MRELKMKKFCFGILVMMLFSGCVCAQLSEIDDGALSGITGQALFNAAKLPGASGSGLTFYRLMLDTQLDLNMNIDSLKLGCGGVNDALSGVGGCDVDISNVSLMGLNATKDGAGAVGSDFTLKRPYLEFAIKNDGNKSTREVVGINIGAQSANGYMGVGLFDPSCGNVHNLSCHKGINSMSGYMGVEMSATASGSGTILGFIPITFVGCFGNTTTNTSDNCGAADKFETVVRGTRMSDIALANKVLKMQVYGGVLNISGKTDLLESLRYIHGIALDDTQNFGISFQREQVAWPKFNPSSGYSGITNTGFWFNLPNVKVLNASSDVGNVGDATSALLGGVALSNIDLGQRPPDNCWGASKFC